MTKKENRILFGIVIAVILIVIIFYALLSNSFDKANNKGKEMTCEENKKVGFHGKVIEVDRNESDNFMFNKFFQITIRTTDSLNKFVHYQYNLPENERLLTSVHIGDSILKLPNVDFFALSDSTGRHEEFKIEKCD